MKKKTESRKERMLLHNIACAIKGNPHWGDEKCKLLAEEIKYFALEVLNSVNKGPYVSDPYRAFQLFKFFKYKLAWSKKEWEQSASIVYGYFKAKKIMDKIREYERIYRETIIEDYLSVIDYLAFFIIRKAKINYANAPGLSSYFIFVPTVALDDVLKYYKKNYE